MKLMSEPEFAIDPKGAIRIGDHIRIAVGQPRAEVEQQVQPWRKGERDMRTGYVWLDLGGLRFGGQPTALSLCFHDHHLTEASWNVQLPGAPMEGGWPTREASDQEIAFVRDTLARQIGFDPKKDVTRFNWGQVWSSFDEKGGMAGNGIRFSI